MNDVEKEINEVETEAPKEETAETEKAAEEEKKRLLAELDNTVDALLAFGVSRDTLIARIQKGGTPNA